MSSVPSGPPPAAALTAADLVGVSREDLVTLVVALSEQVAALSVQVGELTETLTAARSTSRTSSKPPSSDGYRKEAPKPVSRRKRSGRKPGGQPGAAGTTLRQVADPDVVLKHAPATCACCHAPLAGRAPERITRRQVADLPGRVRLVWTEHRVASVRCGCGHLSTAGPADGVPLVAVGPAQYGPRVRAAATWLSQQHFLPAARTALVLAVLLGAHVSPGSVIAWQQQAGAALAVPGGFCERVCDALREADVVHADETGLRTDGALA